MKTLKHFDACELLCPHVCRRFGADGLRFVDFTILDNIEWLRGALGRKIYVNNWHKGGKYSQRGLRCNCCGLVADKTRAGAPYLSAHVLGKAVDFDVEGMTAEDVRAFITARAAEIPHACRLEAGGSWVHMDTACDLSAGAGSRVKTFSA